MMFHACIEDLLVRGIDDWIQAADVASVSLTTGGAHSHEASRELSFRLIRTLFDNGLAEPGMVVEHEGFLPWGIPVDAAMQRIKSNWPTGPEGPELGEVCWLNLTEKGHAQAQELWSRESGREP